MKSATVALDPRLRDVIWLTGVWQLARDRAWQHDRFMPLGIRHWSLQEMARAFELGIIRLA